MDIKCPHCGTEYDITQQEFGKFVTCQVCGRGFVAGAKSPNKPAGQGNQASRPKEPFSAKFKRPPVRGKVIKTRNINWKARGELSNIVTVPWVIQFSSLYVSVFGVFFAACDLIATKSPSSFFQSLVSGAIAVAMGLMLGRFNFVRWVLVVWGGFNVILLFCGARDFLFLWPFHISFILIAILLVTPSARQWYGIRNRVLNFSANSRSSRLAYACAVVLALIMGSFLYAGYSSERKRIRESRDADYACREGGSSSPISSGTTSSSGSPANAKEAIRGALANVRERYRQNLRRFDLVESLYVDRKDLCQLILVEPIGDTPLYTIRYCKESKTLEWPRIMSKDVAEQFIHDRMLMDAYEKVLSSNK